MITSLPFRSLELKRFLESLGWLQVKQAVQDGLFVFEYAEFEPQQLIFGIDDRFVDQADMLVRATRQLGEIYNWSDVVTIRKVTEAPDDVLASRVTSDKIDGQTLPFLFAAQIIESEKKLLQSAANYVEHPQAHYSRNVFNDSQKLLGAARFRHTELGSFVFKVSCGVYALDTSQRFEFSEKEMPFVRRTMINASRGLHNLVSVIESETEQDLVDDIRTGKINSISSNFCEAVAGFGDDEIKNSVDFSVSWSPLLAPPPDVPHGDVRVIPEYFPLIAQIGAALQPSKSEQNRRYVGTVEDLRGRFNDRGQREGKVILWLFVDDGKRTKVSVMLDAEQYAAAHAVHKDNTTVVRVSGVIKRGRQPRKFDLESFEIISS